MFGLLPSRAVLLTAVLSLGLVCSGTDIASAGQTVAKDARLGGDRLRTRFVADLSKRAAFHVFTLADPYRVIVDLSDVRFKLPARLGRKGKGLVSAYRYGLIGPGRARIVIDVNAPVLVNKALILKARDGQPARLVIDMVRTDRKTFLASLDTTRSKRAAPTSQSKATSSPVVPPSAKSPRRSRGGKHVVVLDPGHGGVDPGAVSKSGATEKKIVFAFAKLLRKRLRATGRYKVVLTREIDTYIALRDRVAIARRADADLFLSIHADSLPRRSANGVSGATVYTLSERASDSAAKALAAKENRSDIIAGVELPPVSDEVTDILIDLAQRETKNLSISFTDIVLRSLRGKTRLNKKPHRYAGFAVLKAPDVPSVLIELGYLSHADDEKLLLSGAWREKIADAVTTAIDRYFAEQVARMPF